MGRCVNPTPDGHTHTDYICVLNMPGFTYNYNCDRYLLFMSDWYLLHVGLFIMHNCHYVYATWGAAEDDKYVLHNYEANTNTHLHIRDTSHIVVYLPTATNTYYQDSQRFSMLKFVDLSIISRSLWLFYLIADQTPHHKTCYLHWHQTLSWSTKSRMSLRLVIA